METAFFARYGFKRAEQPINTSIHRILGVRRIVVKRISHMVLVAPLANGMTCSPRPLSIDLAPLSVLRLAGHLIRHQRRQTDIKPAPIRNANDIGLP